MNFRGSMRNKFKDNVITKYYPIGDELDFLNSEQRQNTINKALALGVDSKFTYGKDRRFLEKYLYDDEYVSIPDIAVGIFNEAFCNKLNLRRVKLNKHLMYIDISAFNGCKNLEHIDLVEGLRIIHEGAFQNCESLTELVLPSTLERLSSFSIKNCSKLKRIVVQNDVITIEDIEKAINWIGLDDIEMEIVMPASKNNEQIQSHAIYNTSGDVTHCQKLNVTVR